MNIHRPLFRHALLLACLASAGTLTHAAADAAPGSSMRTERPATVTAADAASVVIEPIEWRVPSRRGLDAAHQQQLRALLAQSPQRQVARMPAQALGRPARLRAVITDVQSVGAAPDVLAVLASAGARDPVGAAVTLEAFDAQTGASLARLDFARFVPLVDFHGAASDRLAPAEAALQQAAEQFGATLVAR